MTYALIVAAIHSSCNYLNRKRSQTNTPNSQNIIFIFIDLLFFA